MIALDIKVPPEDIRSLDDMFARYAAHFGGNIPKAVEQTAVKIVVALRARTAISKRKRRIVPNPAGFKGRKTVDRYGRAHAHIMQWYEYHGSGKRTGRVQTWLPKLRDLAVLRKSAKYAIERYTQKGRRYTPVGGFDPLEKIKIADAKAMAESKQRGSYFLDKENNPKFGKRGVARASWAWMLKRLGQSQKAEQPEDSTAIQVSKHALGKGDGLTYIDLVNMLGYIRKALTKGDLSTVLATASTMIRKQIERDHAKAAQAAGVKT